MQLVLNNFNPWWRLKVVPAHLVGKPRKILTKLKDSISVRQITMVTGLRRVGKTTLMFQLIDKLIQDDLILPEYILYYSFDEVRYDLDDFFSYYQLHILGAELQEVDRVFIFLDEIQKLRNWSDRVKILYDMYPNVKILLSGSANLVLKGGSRESLAGRFFDYSINPLDFPEFLTFRQVDIEPSKEVIFQQTIAREFQRFLKTGGFIEAMSFNETQLVQYFRDSILERVAYRDIPDVFSVSRPELLLRLIHILAQRPGLYLEYKNLGNDLKVDQRTITTYFDYLEYSYLVQKLYNFSTNLLTSEKKLKRVYLANTGFTCALTGELDLPSLLEQFWINLLKSKYFYRSPQKDEVDLIFAFEKTLLPIEIKIRQNISSRALGPILKFLRRFGLEKGLVISLQTDTQVRQNGKTIRVLPYWKYWSIIEEIGSGLSAFQY